MRTSMRRNIYSRFHSNSEALSSELVWSVEEMLPRYYMHSDVFSRIYTRVFRPNLLKYSTVSASFISAIHFYYRTLQSLRLYIDRYTYSHIVTNQKPLLHIPECLYILGAILICLENVEEMFTRSLIFIRFKYSLNLY